MCIQKMNMRIFMLKTNKTFIWAPTNFEASGHILNHTNGVFHVLGEVSQSENVSIQDPSTLGPLHTWDWEPVTITLQALSLVQKARPVQVRFTLCLRDQRSMRMQDGCKVYMDSYMASNGSCFIGTWIIFKNHFLELHKTGRPWHFERSQPLIYSTCYIMLSCLRTCINRNSSK